LLKKKDYIFIFIFNPSQQIRAYRTERAQTAQNEHRRAERAQTRRTSTDAQNEHRTSTERARVDLVDPMERVVGELLRLVNECMVDISMYGRHFNESTAYCEEELRSDISTIKQLPETAAERNMFKAHSYNSLNRTFQPLPSAHLNNKKQYKKK
jgi:hypothetical protein